MDFTTRKLKCFQDAYPYSRRVSHEVSDTGIGVSALPLCSIEFLLCCTLRINTGDLEWDLPKERDGLIVVPESKRVYIRDGIYGLLDKFIQLAIPEKNLARERDGSVE
jgi:hypothetical protein